MSKEEEVKSRRNFIFSLMALWLVMVGIAFIMEGAVPVVTIKSPPGGWTNERRIKIKGTVSDPSIHLITVVVNGKEFWARSDGGNFDQNVILANGENTVLVAARNRDGEGKDLVVFYTNLSKTDVQIVLNFPPQPFYVDLWITQPDGEKCYWANRETKAGGVLHDLYQDAPGGGVGMGSQCYTISNALGGNYLMQVDYWAGGQLGEGEVPGGPYGESAKMPIVPIKVDVILYEGTDFETRKLYTGVLKKPGDTYTVGILTVKSPTLFDSEKSVKEIQTYDK